MYKKKNFGFETLEIDLNSGFGAAAKLFRA